MSAAGRYWLGSQEFTAWSEPRAVALTEVALARNDHRAYWADLDPPSPGGRRRVVIAARHPGKDIDPPSRLPVVVDLWFPRDDSKHDGPVELDELELAGVGELYASRDEAGATTGGW